MNDIKPIETIYKGYRFRSRLEARWAVFFDEAGVKWIYEMEGFDLNGERYLPDFWMPEWNCWVEIKPEKPKLKHYNKLTCRLEAIHRREYSLCQTLAEHTHSVVMLIGGQPFVREQVQEDFIDHESEYEVALFCPDMVVHSNEGSPNGAEFGVAIYDDGTPSYLIIEETFSLSYHLYGWLVRQYKCHPDYFEKPLPERGRAHEIVEADRVYWSKKHGGNHPNWYYGIAQDGYTFGVGVGGDLILKLDLSGFALEENISQERLIKAYNAARQARFEYGENGAPKTKKQVRPKRKR